MEFDFLLKGYALGLAFAAPVGSVGIFCMQRTLTRGLIFGLFAGLGAAKAGK